MRSLVKALGGLLVAVLVMAGLGRAAMADDKGTIYYLAPTLFDEFQVETKDMVELLFKELGYKVVTLDAQQRADLQNSQMDDTILQKPKAIILAAVDFDAISPGIEKAHAAGIPIMVYDRQIKNRPIEFTSVAGTVEIGKLSAEQAVKLLTAKYGEPKGKILSIMGDSADSYTLDIEKGFEEVLAKTPNIQVIPKPSKDWEPTNAANTVQDQLLVNPDIDMLFIHADHLAPPIVSVLENAGKKKGDILIVDATGMPAGLKLLREGWVQTIVEQPLYGQVYGLAMFLDHVIEKKPIKPGTYDVVGLPSTLTIEAWGPNLSVPGGVITKDNVDDPKFWGNLKPPGIPVPKVE
ncbi:MAG: sugar ABC transporter substrate-binding protein [Parvibaculaceae bacterium]